MLIVLFEVNEKMIDSNVYSYLHRRKKIFAHFRRLYCVVAFILILLGKKDASRKMNQYFCLIEIHFFNRDKNQMLLKCS
jgi:hypothetical protein